MTHDHVRVDRKQRRVEALKAYQRWKAAAEQGGSHGYVHSMWESFLRLKDLSGLSISQVLDLDDDEEVTA